MHVGVFLHFIHHDNEYISSDRKDTTKAYLGATEYESVTVSVCV